MCPVRLRSLRPVPSKGEEGLKRSDEGQLHRRLGFGAAWVVRAVQSGHVLESDLSRTFSWPASQSRDVLPRVESFEPGSHGGTLLGQISLLS